MKKLLSATFILFALLCLSISVNAQGPGDPLKDEPLSRIYSVYDKPVQDRQSGHLKLGTVKLVEDGEIYEFSNPDGVPFSLGDVIPVGPVANGEHAVLLDPNSGSGGGGR